MRVRYLDWSHAPHGDEPLASHRTPFHHQRPVSVPLDHDPEDPLDTPTSDLSDLGEAPCGGRSHPLAEELKARGSESPIVAEDVDLPQDVRTHIQSTVPPALEGDEKFDVILGSDLLYEVCSSQRGVCCSSPRGVYCSCDMQQQIGCIFCLCVFLSPVDTIDGVGARVFCVPVCLRAGHVHVDVRADLCLHMPVLPPWRSWYAQHGQLLHRCMLFIQSFTLPEYRAFSQDSHASMVAAAISHRMRALGCALLCLPVREKVCGPLSTLSVAALTQGLGQGRAVRRHWHLRTSRRLPHHAPASHCLASPL